MIYLKDEATGVAVEDDALEAEPMVRAATMNAWTHYTHAEADALLRGLLRWKLETTDAMKLEAELNGEILRWAAEKMKKERGR